MMNAGAGNYKQLQIAAPTFTGGSITATATNQMTAYCLMRLTVQVQCHRKQKDCDSKL